MYRERIVSRATDLEQGDLIANLIVPAAPPGAKGLSVREGSKMRPAEDKDLRPPHKDLRIVMPGGVVPLVLVVSNSCDNCDGHPLLVAPVSPFEFRSTTAVEQWREISQIATSASSVRSFYLPDRPDFGQPRGEAHFGELVSLQPTFVDRCLQAGDATVVGGLTAEAQAHLRWKLGVFFGRNAREDDAWPSNSDLQLKAAWLEAQISAGGGGRKEAYQADLDRIRARLGGG